MQERFFSAYTWPGGDSDVCGGSPDVFKPPKLHEVYGNTPQGRGPRGYNTNSGKWDIEDSFYVYKAHRRERQLSDLTPTFANEGKQYVDLIGSSPAAQLFLVYVTLVRPDGLGVGLGDNGIDSASMALEQIQKISDVGFSTGGRALSGSEKEMLFWLARSREEVRQLKSPVYYGWADKDASARLVRIFAVSKLMANLSSGPHPSAKEDTAAMKQTFAGLVNSEYSDFDFTVLHKRGTQAKASRYNYENFEWFTAEAELELLKSLDLGASGEMGAYVASLEDRVRGVGMWKPPPVATAITHSPLAIELPMDLRVFGLFRKQILLAVRNAVCGKHSFDHSAQIWTAFPARFTSIVTAENRRGSSRKLEFIVILPLLITKIVEILGKAATTGSEPQTNQIRHQLNAALFEKRKNGDAEPSNDAIAMYLIWILDWHTKNPDAGNRAAAAATSIPPEKIPESCQMYYCTLPPGQKDFDCGDSLEFENSRPYAHDDLRGVLFLLRDQLAPIPSGQLKSDAEMVSSFFTVREILCRIEEILPWHDKIGALKSDNEVLLSQAWRDNVQFVVGSSRVNAESFCAAASKHLVVDKDVLGYTMKQQLQIHEPALDLQIPSAGPRCTARDICMAFATQALLLESGSQSEEHWNVVYWSANLIEDELRDVWDRWLLSDPLWPKKDSSLTSEQMNSLAEKFCAAASTTRVIGANALRQELSKRKIREYNELCHNTAVDFCVHVSQKALSLEWEKVSSEGSGSSESKAETLWRLAFLEHTVAG